MPKEKEFISVSEAARKLGCTLGYVYDLLYAGRLKAEKITGRWKIPTAEVEARIRRRVEQ